MSDADLRDALTGTLNSSRVDNKLEGRTASSSFQKKETLSE